MGPILDMLANQIDERTIKQISTQLGTDERSTQQAVKTALPLLLGALERNATADQDQAQSLTNALRRDHQGNILDNIPAALNNTATLQDGSAILGHILGAKRNNVETGISKYSGLNQNSSGQLLAMLAPVVMGALGKMQQQRNLDANGVAGLLNQERRETEPELGGLAQLLDMDRDGDISDDIFNLGSNLLGSWLSKK